MAHPTQTIFCLMGPTASGKTELACHLVQHFPFEIISVDSAMVYRGMDIGTAKPTSDILRIAPHRLIDIRDPIDSYSVAQFREDALREMEAIFAMKKIPLLVGGTMLYFHALQSGLADLPSAHLSIRTQLKNEGDLLGWRVMHERLLKIDPASAERIHPHDTQRIQRALEVFELTGKNLSAWLATNHKTPSQYGIHNLVVAPSDRSILHNRIEKRFETMLDQGLVEEVQRLFNCKGLTIETPAIRSVGYRQVWEYLENKMTFMEMREKGKIATRQLAKRQLTWLRNWNNQTHWFDSESKKLVEQVTHSISTLLK